MVVLPDENADINVLVRCNIGGNQPIRFTVAGKIMVNIKSGCITSKNASIFWGGIIKNPQKKERDMKKERHCWKMSKASNCKRFPEAERRQGGHSPSLNKNATWTGDGLDGSGQKFKTRT